MLDPRPNCGCENGEDPGAPNGWLMLPGKGVDMNWFEIWGKLFVPRGEPNGVGDPSPKGC